MPTPSPAASAAPTTLRVQPIAERAPLTACDCTVICGDDADLTHGKSSPCAWRLECQRLGSDRAALTAARAIIIETAKSLGKRGWFEPTSCADKATATDMAAMRAALAKLPGAAS